MDINIFLRIMHWVILTAALSVVVIVVAEFACALYNKWHFRKIDREINDQHDLQEAIRKTYRHDDQLKANNHKDNDDAD